ncbi:MAG TPA: bifunctional acetate--CoA ligase family protein/GNAT family N-acetyltransferase, partial [Bryobacteraceae bacterium]|nr:bifunctional acetate--CoA ligase family protein/GNAT family N-acetyltransferase [Bryobacteraceae bacterium]
MRIIGPNCLGMMSPHYGLNATFAPSMARTGNLAFLSQSGALCTAILDWSHRERMGFSAFVSVGSMLDVGWGDLIRYLGDDPKTRSIAIYMESVGDARSFMSAAREVALSKPIIVLKPGRSEAAAKAAASHTGALTGQDDVLDAAFRRCGVVRVDTISELFDLSEALDKQPRPKGRRLAIVTNAGGPAVLATDALLAGGGQLTELAPDTVAHLDGMLPPHWSHANPVDILGDASPERFRKVVDIVGRDPSTDGLLIVLAPTGPTDPVAVAEALAPALPAIGKPLMASWMGGDQAARGEAILNEAGIPTYSYPDAAARIFDLTWNYSARIDALYETPEKPAPTTSESARAEAGSNIEKIRASGRLLLTESESKNLLAAWGISSVRTEVARTEEEAAAAAGEMGFPVAVKLHSETITHKTDVGGVQLNIGNSDDVIRAFQNIRQSVSAKAGAEHFQGVTVQPMAPRDGYELILGSTLDPQFGPVILFGSGGQLVEVYQDRAIGLPPLNTTLAESLMRRTRIFAALGGVRGRSPVNLVALENTLARFSDLVMENPAIKEIEMNPLYVSPSGVSALDARVMLHPPGAAHLPRPAIRPYPAQYVQPWRLADGTSVLIRPIRPEDEPAIARLHTRLSEETVLQRFLGLISLERRRSHQRLIPVCFSDYDREIALVVEDGAEILGVGRLSKAHFEQSAELAVLIEDRWQRRGIGSELGRRLLAVARDEKLLSLTMTMRESNGGMIALARKLGFALKPEGGGIMAG